MERKMPPRYGAVMFWALVLIAFSIFALLLVSFGYDYPLFSQNQGILQLAFLFGVIILSVSFGPELVILYGRREILKKVEEMISYSDQPKYPRYPERPAYLLADSVDRIILELVNSTSGDFEAIPEILHQKALGGEVSGFENRLAKLVLLGLISIPRKRIRSRVYLTARGLDALNAPAALFVSNIPPGIWQYVYQMKMKLAEEQWDGVAVSMAQVLESMLADRLSDVKESTPEVWKQVVSKNPNFNEDSLGAGVMIGALCAVGVIERGSFEERLLDDLNSLRNRVHPPQEGVEAYTFGAPEAARMDLLLDIILQLWYGAK